MPMPTPPKPGEEPTDESELYRYHLRRLITWYLEALDPLTAGRVRLAAAAPRRRTRSPPSARMPSRPPSGGC